MISIKRNGVKCKVEFKTSSRLTRFDYQKYGITWYLIRLCIWMFMLHMFENLQNYENLFLKGWKVQNFIKK